MSVSASVLRARSPPDLPPEVVLITPASPLPPIHLNDLFQGHCPQMSPVALAPGSCSAFINNLVEALRKTVKTLTTLPGPLARRAL